MEEAMTKKLPRGIRLNNPGNIRHGDKWQGLALEAEQDDPSFCRFIDPSWGIRAIARLLIMYQDKYHIRTVRAIIDRWAPTVENDTNAYIAAVCASTGFDPDEKLDLYRYEASRPIVEAIIRHENGRGPLKTTNTWYERSVIDVGLQRAGIVNQAATIAAVPVTKETVAATGTAGIGVAQLADVAPQVLTAMDTQQDHLSSGSWVRIAIAVATIGLAVFIAYSQVKKHQNGVVP
jgi:hypothetical protein